MKDLKTVIEESRRCAYCGEKVEDLSLNCCPKCRNILWFRPFAKKKVA